ncbi:MAG: hypothetical protein GX596_12205 [Propionibacterium sp.]|nr:hypothetical protein [Propionibacterium sp.]
MLGDSPFSNRLCATAGIESVLEWLFLRDVLRPHGLPEPRRQASTEAGRVDCLYDEFGVVMELDGLRDHQDGSRDMFRDNEHVLAGRKALRFGFTAVARDGCRAAAQVARGLRKAGWQGRMRSCGVRGKSGCQPCSVDDRDLEPPYTQRIA